MEKKKFTKYSKRFFYVGSPTLHLKVIIQSFVWVVKLRIIAACQNIKNDSHEVEQPWWGIFEKSKINVDTD